MNCPKCKNIDLRKRGYDSPSNCHICGGMWIDHDKLPEFMGSMRSSVGEQTDANLNDDKTGMCPLGHGVMIRTKIDIDEPFYLEKCGACGGVWFDNGEWKRVINLNLAENINELWCKSWQIKQRKEQSRKKFLELNRSFLGDQLFEELIKISEILKEHPEKGRAMALLQQEIFK